jgi:hypothetical protein
MLLNYSLLPLLVYVHYHTDHVYIYARSDKHIDFHAKYIAESNNLTKYMSNTHRGMVKRHQI